MSTFIRENPQILRLYTNFQPLLYQMDRGCFRFLVHASGSAAPIFKYVNFKSLGFNDRKLAGDYNKAFVITIGYLGK